MLSNYDGVKSHSLEEFFDLKEFCLEFNCANCNNREFWVNSIAHFCLDPLLPGFDINLNDSPFAYIPF